ncbi:MAG: hypothetical protein QXS66_04340 [Thermoproteota archaeon]|nr:hypothetical protein [Candidatus Brockarchaeota archaeon]
MMIEGMDVADGVGGLPSAKFHCGVLAVGALRRAIREFFRDRGSKPEWMSEKETFEEKQALEEELAKVISRKFIPGEGK